MPRVWRTQTRSLAAPIALAILAGACSSTSAAETGDPTTTVVETTLPPSTTTPPEDDPTMPVVPTTTAPPTASEACPAGPLTADDADGDGIPDVEEQAGWPVVVTDGSGVAASRTVSSSAGATDTDGDGRCDGVERLDGTDPTTADTDGDGLDDDAELQAWGSSPLAVDSDGDSRGNPRLFDGSEVTELGTSPTLADTDGDAIDDFAEAIERGAPFHPLIANVPQMELTLAGETSITLDAERTSDSSVVETVETGLVQSSSTTQSSTDTETLSTIEQTTDTVGVEAEAAFPRAFSVKGSYEHSAMSGYSNEQQTSFTDTSTQESQRRYDRALELSRSDGVRLSGGTIAVGVQIRNVGDVSFELTDLSVTVLRRRSENPIDFTTVQTLTLALDRTVVLAPGQSSAVLRAAGDVPVDVALELMKSPASLSFESSFDLTNAEGHSFAFLAEHTNSQTALVTVDYGNGNLVRRRVATNVERVAGATDGITAAAAMELLGLPYETTPNAAGVAVLTAIDDKVSGATVSTARDGSGFWAVIGSAGTLVDATTSFDDIVLTAGEALTVMFVQDRDGDGLFLRQEIRYGTSDESVDSDGDGISDVDEIENGWSVSADVPPYPATVYSDPASADRDGDGLDDPTERSMATDPNSRDTDGDGFCDGPGVSGCLEDPEPLVAAVNNPPSVSIAPAGADGLNVTVQVDSADGDFADGVASVTVDWGDGSSDRAQPGSDQLSHRYPAGGTYTVAATATDRSGATASDTTSLDVVPKLVGVELEMKIQRVTIGETCGIAEGKAEIFGDIEINGEAAFSKGRGSAVKVASNSDVPLKQSTFRAIDTFGDGKAAFKIKGELRDADAPDAWPIPDPDDGMGRWNFSESDVGASSKQASDGDPCSLARMHYNVTLVREIFEQP